MLLSALLAAFSGLAQARPVALGGVLISPEVQTRPLTGAVEGLPVEVLPRLGVAVQNSSSGLSLSYAGRTLTFVGSRWLAQNIASVPATLPVPEGLGGGLYVPLSVLAVLGVPTLADTPDVLDFAQAGAAPISPVRPVPAQPNPVPANPVPASLVPASPVLPMPPIIQPPVIQPPVTQPPAPPTLPVPPGFTPVAALSSVRSSRTLDRNIELQRVVMEFSAPVASPCSVTAAE